MRPTTPETDSHLYLIQSADEADGEKLAQMLDELVPGTSDAQTRMTIVENLVIVELKSVEQIHPVHPKQLLTYLRLSNKRLGLLINFNSTLIRNGITRIVNGLPE